MSFIDHASFPLFRTVSFKAAESKSDDDFAVNRVKSMQLPTIESCQSSIFRELRHREEVQVSQSAKEPKQVRVGLFGLPNRLGSLFARPSQQLH